MFIDSLIMVSATASLALIWRALLLDHPLLLARVQSVPFIGGALQCGFCSALWLSLVAVLIYNPLAPWGAGMHPFIALGISWLAVGAWVLILRNTTALLMEAVGVLAHQHHASHKEN